MNRLPGMNRPLVEFLSRRLEGAGYRITRQEVTPGRHNLLAVRRTPRVLFCTHTDTVRTLFTFFLRWQHPARAGSLRRQRQYGGNAPGR